MTAPHGGTFELPGLREPAEIVVDRWGVPHIYARNTYDAFRAQGFNAARDRLFQIDLWHRRGLGQLAEVFGPTYVEQDRATRLFLYRGDMHRHTDVSQDFKYDGSLLEGYRYGIDAASFDYISLTDHQTGYDQEFTWWENQQLVDLFQVPGFFTPLFGSERSLRFPNGHRNTIFAHRGVRPLPIPPDEASAKVGAAKLYQYLKKNNGISMPHSSATDQGTDWRDNDPEVEPIVEIYQGYRNSYEYEGAPKAASALNPHAQKSGWQPQGFWWNALAKGYKLGVQASSDHWSTHISYACLLTDNFTKKHEHEGRDNA